MYFPSRSNNKTSILRTSFSSSSSKEDLRPDEPGTTTENNISMTFLFSVDTYSVSLHEGIEMPNDNKTSIAPYIVNLIITLIIYSCL